MTTNPADINEPGADSSSQAGDPAPTTECKPAAEVPMPPDRLHSLEDIRPPGPKAAVLQARRQRLAQRKQARPGCLDRTTDGCRLVSDDGTVSFVLSALPGGLCVERTQLRAPHLQLIQQVVFSSDAAFSNWCAEEPIRFDYPVLYQHLRSEGHDLLRR